MSVRRAATRRDGVAPVHRKKDYSQIDQGIRMRYPEDEKKENDEFDIDIVLVPGLGADPITSWQTTKDGKVVWDWTTSAEGLVKGLSLSPRILLFTYQSAWYGAVKVKQYIDAIALQLLTALKSKREKTSQRQRPVVFISHSMGGLVVGKAIGLADRRRDLFSDMFETIAASIFFGTPFQGAPPATYAGFFAQAVGERFDAATKSSLLDLMKPDNEPLRELCHDMVWLSNAKSAPPIELFTFYEEDPTDPLNFGLVSLFEKFGAKTPKSFVFVPREAAILQGVDNIGIHCTHRDLVKFSSFKDHRWDQFVRPNMHRIIARAYGVVKQRLYAVRGIDQDLISDINKSLMVWPEQARRKHGALRQNFPPSEWINKEMQAAWPSFTGSIQPSTDAGSTCLWIMGHQGRGKTSATMAVTETIEALANTTATDREPITLIYFFCEENLADFSTAEDVLKSWISQLIEAQKLLAKNAKQFVKKKVAGASKETGKALSQYSVENLWQSFADMLSDELFKGQLFIVLNNVHCLSGEQESTTKFIRYLQAELDNSASHDSNYSKRKWFITSRDVFHVKPALTAPGVRLIDLEDPKYGDQVQQALKTHAKSTIEELRKEKSYNRALAYFISSLIGRRAQNTQWIDIIAVQLRQLPTSELETDQDLKVRRLLENMPQDLIALLNLAWVQIFKNNGPDVEKIKEVLRTLVLTFKDPTIAELGVIAGMSYDEPRKSELCQIVECCKPLLYLERRSSNETVVCFLNGIVKQHLSDHSESLLSTSKEEEKWQHGVIALRSFTHLKTKFESAELDQQVKEAIEIAAREEEEAANEDENEPDAEEAQGDVDADAASAVASDTGSDEGDEASSDDGQLANEDSELDYDSDDGDDSDDVESRVIKKVALPYTVEHWLHHASKATLEIAEDLSAETEFWAKDSVSRRRWVKEFHRLTGKLSDFRYSDDYTHNFDKFTALHVAASVGFSELVRALIKNGHKEELTMYDGLFNTPLQLAAFYGRTNTVDQLLDNDAPINDGAQERHDTPLHMAASEGHVKVMKKILTRKGVDINAISGDSGSIINAAISSGNRDAVELLADAGSELMLDLADVEPPLCVAARVSELSLFEYLLAKFAGRLPADEYSKALVAAAGAGKTEIFETLSTGFKHEDAWYQEALDAAVTETRWNIVTILLASSKRLDYNMAFRLAATGPEPREDLLKDIWQRYGASISAATLSESLYEATDLMKEPTVELLLKDFKVNANATGDEFGDALTASANDGTMAILNMLLDAGAEVNSEHGYALQSAATRGHTDIVKRLLEKGADVNACTTNENFPNGTALQGACEGGQNKLEIISILLEHGADPNKGAGASAPPIYAITEVGEMEAFELLMGKKPKVNVHSSAEDSDSGTALINAAAFLPEQALHMLIEAGAELDAVDNDGDTALMSAAYWNNADSVAYLLEQGADITHTNHDGKNVLQLASEVDSDDSMAILITHMSAVIGHMKTAVKAGSVDVKRVLQQASNIEHKRSTDEDEEANESGEDDANNAAKDTHANNEEDVASPVSDDLMSPTITFQDAPGPVDFSVPDATMYGHVQQIDDAFPKSGSPVSHLTGVSNAPTPPPAPVQRISSWAQGSEVLSHTPPRQFTHELPGDMGPPAQIDDAGLSRQPVRRKPAPGTPDAIQSGRFSPAQVQNEAGHTQAPLPSNGYGQVQNNYQSYQGHSAYPESIRYGSSGSPQPPFHARYNQPDGEDQPTHSPNLSSGNMQPPAENLQSSSYQGNGYIDPYQAQSDLGHTSSPEFPAPGPPPGPYQSYQNPSQPPSNNFQPYQAPPPPAAPQAYRPPVYATPPFDAAAYRQRQQQRQGQGQEQVPPPAAPHPPSHSPHTSQTYQPPPGPPPANPSISANSSAYQAQPYANASAYNSNASTYAPHSNPSAPQPWAHYSATSTSTSTPDYDGEGWGSASVPMGPPPGQIGPGGYPAAPPGGYSGGGSPGGNPGGGPGGGPGGRLGPRRTSSFFTETGTGMKSAFEKARKGMFSPARSEVYK